MYRSLSCLLTVSTLLSGLASAYRPVQFVKHTGEAGRADQAFSMTQHYNESTGENDLWMRMAAYRYNSDHKGWAALGLGPSMTGALMFILYGDPKAPGAPVTLSVRTADGHHPPLPLADIKPPFIPPVDISYAQFEEYSGEFTHSDMGKPSHVAVVDFVVRGYDNWHAISVSNTSTNQAFIWSSNFKQDFEGDYSVDRHIDMHLFGLGFGFLYIDLLNAQTPTPFYGLVHDTEGHLGVNEIGDPEPPTDEELATGADFAQKMAAAVASGSNADETNAPETTAADETAGAKTQGRPAPTATAAASQGETDDHHDDGDGDDDHANEDLAGPHTHDEFSLRSWMWHLHGFLMVGAFLVLYPLGTYLLRSGRPTAFNFHWTIQALGSACVAISAVIGVFNSHSISIPHQYAGLAIVFALALQVLLGWRHHMFFVNHNAKNWLSPAHIWLGRVALPAGFVNIITGMKLRQYGWFTLLIVMAVMAVELLGLFWFLRGAARRNARIDGGAAGLPKGLVGGGNNNASVPEEEYFQLAGDDDEFSDSDAEAEAGSGAARNREEEKREQSRRLARLDRV